MHGAMSPEGILLQEVWLCPHHWRLLPKGVFDGMQQPVHPRPCWTSAAELDWLLVCHTQGALSDDAVWRLSRASGRRVRPAGWMAHISWSGPAWPAWFKAAAARFQCRPGRGHDRGGRPPTACYNYYYAHPLPHCVGKCKNMLTGHPGTGTGQTERRRPSTLTAPPYGGGGWGMVTAGPR